MIFLRPSRLYRGYFCRAISFVKGIAETRLQLSVEKDDLVISTYHIDNANPSTPSEPIAKMQTSILNDEDHFPDSEL